MQSVIQPEPGAMVTPNVRLVRPLGAGGMGSVWIADHLALKTEVVVKFMAAELAAHPDAKARFEREAAASANVKSPHVVQVFDYGVTEGGVPYIVMELLEGRDLASYMNQLGAIPPRDVVEIVGQVCKALTKAHGVGIVHRDIKPENIFLCGADGGEAFVKILDFGIAKADSTKLGSGTRTGQVVGTPYYMSPEQIVGAKSVDLRADLWSLGVVVFEALAGRRPFEGETVGGLTLAIHGPTPSLTAINGSLPSAVDAWFARACAKDASERFASARELSQALSEALGSVPAGAAKTGISIRPGPVLTPGAPPGAASTPAAPRQYDAQAATALGASMATDPLGLPKKRGPGVWIGLAGGGLLFMVAVAITTATVMRKPAAAGGTPSAGGTATATATTGPTATATASPTATPTATATSTPTATATATGAGATTTSPPNAGTSTGRPFVHAPKASASVAKSAAPPLTASAPPTPKPKPTNNDDDIR
jgi:serine/threonine-protein kinase